MVTYHLGLSSLFVHVRNNDVYSPEMANNAHITIQEEQT